MESDELEKCIIFYLLNSLNCFISVVVDNLKLNLTKQLENLLIKRDKLYEEIAE